jgi:hypothetical protein
MNMQGWEGLVHAKGCSAILPCMITDLVYARDCSAMKADSRCCRVGRLILRLLVQAKDCSATEALLMMAISIMV